MLAVVAPDPPADAGAARSRLEELDPTTLARAQAHDPVAMRAFVVRYQRPVFALLSRLVGRGPHVEDLAQEAFLKAFRALPGFEPAGAARLSTWLLTIATHLALDARKRKRIPSVSMDDAPAAASLSSLASQGTPETEIARRELGQALARAAARLSDDMRAAFLLADVHGFTMKEIALALSIPENTAKTRVFRAREQMRESMRDMRERLP
jgi:RNA polymerase sigma-70 factor (ECF subfamily)